MHVPSLLRPSSKPWLEGGVGFFFWWIYIWSVYSSRSYRTCFQHKFFTCITYRKPQYSHGHCKFLPALYSDPVAPTLTGLASEVTGRTWVWFTVCSLDIQLDIEISVSLSYRNNSQFWIFLLIVVCQF